MPTVHSDRLAVHVINQSINQSEVLADNSDRRYKIYPPRMVTRSEIKNATCKHLQSDLQKEWLGPSMSCKSERALRSVATWRLTPKPSL